MDKIEKSIAAFAIVAIVVIPVVVAVAYHFLLKLW